MECTSEVRWGVRLYSKLRSDALESLGANTWSMLIRPELKPEAELTNDISGPSGVASSAKDLIFGLPLASLENGDLHKRVRIHMLAGSVGFDNARMLSQSHT